MQPNCFVFEGQELTENYMVALVSSHASAYHFGHVFVRRRVNTAGLTVHWSLGLCSDFLRKIFFLIFPFECMQISYSSCHAQLLDDRIAQKDLLGVYIHVVYGTTLLILGICDIGKQMDFLRNTDTGYYLSAISTIP
ncbi:hypothetical protein CEXT_82601 [Caerostris extrusa]|uniref:Uncharacterized protein n=1 Tax=Caerostris extrusa TaxID=172846 RepID=A0AAV4M3I2_CAEEX|nr:hypothetical protein CEXT_82601 [Caerostris extrusa]